MRQYIRGDALKLIEGLGHSGYAYQAAKERLERKYGGQQRKILLHIDQSENFKPIQNETPKDIEKFPNLLDIAVTNLKKAKRGDELGNGLLFCSKLLRKLPQRMEAQYHRWIFEHRKNGNVEIFRSFIIQEAELQMAASETVPGLHLKKQNYKKNPQSLILWSQKARKNESEKMHFLSFESSFVGL